MTSAHGNAGESTRRQFLAASGTAVVATALTATPRIVSGAMAAPAVRRSLTDPGIGPVLDSYKKGIAAMLALPPTDPRNWYRVAFIHELDCPHQNFWFLPWHRGYIGYFEEIIRDLSHDPSFALPYWDWTANPGFPAAFSAVSTVLNPNNTAYIAAKNAFMAAYTPVVNSMYGAFSADQLAQLAKRPSAANAATLTSQISGDFFPRGSARNLNFGGGYPAAVSVTTLNTSLRTTHYSVNGGPTTLNFGSSVAPNHSQPVGEGILESQPHDHVHGAVGGFMGRFLSPVDPIFWMHHCNIDRIWDIWNRKQAKLHLSTLPEPADLAKWQNEPFLFYVQGNGAPVANTKAGDFATPALFNYVYTKGSGENVIPSAAPLLAAARASVASNLSRNVLDFAGPTTSTGNFADADVAKIGAPEGQELVAKIELELPEDHAGLRFFVLVNPPADVTHVDFNDPSFAGSISPFGSHVTPAGGHAMTHTVTFDIPLTDAIRKLRAANRWDDSKPISVQVVPATRGVTLKQFSVPIKSITLNKF